MLDRAAPPLEIDEGDLLCIAAVSQRLDRGERPSLHNAAISAAVLISTPYALDYDFVVLGLGIAWLWRDGEAHGFGPWERTLLAFVWIVPLFARSLAEYSLIPIGLISSLTILAMALARALRPLPARSDAEAALPR